MKRVNSYGNGDHYVHIKIAVPKKMTKEQKALMQVSFSLPQSTRNKLLNRNNFVPQFDLVKFAGIRRVGNGHTRPDIWSHT